MRQLIAEMTRTKRRTAITATVFSLMAAAGIATGAWFVFSGFHNGAGAGKFASATTSDAVTLTANPAALAPSDQVQGPGQKGSLGFFVTNNASVTEQITSITPGSGTITTSPDASCASHLSIDYAALQSGLGGPIGAGTSNAIVVPANTLVADSTLPASCSSADVSVTGLTGTTTP